MSMYMQTNLYGGYGACHVVLLGVKAAVRHGMLRCRHVCVVVYSSIANEMLCVVSISCAIKQGDFSAAREHSVTGLTQSLHRAVR